mmetsp:Transcript_44241/g.103466  ORF Transcript_44241/g.103466 Transcript_44241/m.103466 type:complete len:93 (+) Transcript_44241:380-658(+)
MSQGVCSMLRTSKILHSCAHIARLLQLQRHRLALPHLRMWSSKDAWLRMLIGREPCFHARKLAHGKRSLKFWHGSWSPYLADAHKVSLALFP